jgi:hypothetical protein
MRVCIIGSSSLLALQRLAVACIVSWSLLFVGWDGRCK